MKLRPSANGFLTVQNNRIVLSDVLPHVSIRLKSVFARIPKTQTITFNLPFTDEMAADILWFSERWPFDMAKATLGKLKRAAKRFRDDRAATEAIMLPDWKPGRQERFRPGFELELDQARALEVLKRRHSLLLGDDVGLGKTFVAMAAAMTCGPTAVVVEPHLADQWAIDFIVRCTEMTVHVIEGTVPYDLPAADIYVFRYSNIHGWVDIAATGFFRLVVFDEIQQLRTGSTSVKGAAALRFTENAEYRLALSATPIFNYGSEIWNIMSFIDPDVLGSWIEFITEWCYMGDSHHWLVRDPDALGMYLKSTGAFLRRVRQGRPVNRLVVKVAYDDTETVKHEEITRALAMKVLESKFGESGQAARELDAMARRLTGVGKARGIAAYARILLSAGIPIIMSLWHRDVYDIIMKELSEFRLALYTGTETSKQKDKVKRDFIAGRLDGILISNRSGAGLDGLQNRCSTLIVGELDWSPKIYEQLLGRIDRRGQEAEELTMIFCTCDYGSDPTIMTVNAVKNDQARRITDPGVPMDIPYTDESHIKQLAREYIERMAA